MTLSDWLTINDVSDAAFAARVGTTRHTVWRWRTGVKKPSWVSLALIADATGGSVTANDFVSVAGQ